MLILKFHPGMRCLHVSFSFFHPRMKFHPCLFETVFTREISSGDETRPEMKSSLSIVKCLLLFTRFCRDKISSQDELIPLKTTGMKFHPGMKKRRVNTSSPDEILKWVCFFFHYWRMYSNMVPKVNVFELKGTLMQIWKSPDMF